MLDLLGAFVVIYGSSPVAPASAPGSARDLFETLNARTAQKKQSDEPEAISSREFAFAFEQGVLSKARRKGKDQKNHEQSTINDNTTMQNTLPI